MQDRGISLLSIPGKLYGRVVINRVRELKYGAMEEEQSGFRERRGCADQIFTVRCLSEKHLEKHSWIWKKHMIRVDREALWQLLRVYGVGGGLLAAIEAFYKESEACVRVEGG